MRPRGRIPRSARLRAAGTVAVLASCVGCGAPQQWRAAAAAPAPARLEASRDGERVAPQWLALPELTGAFIAGAESDGSQRVLVDGVRLLDRPDGTLIRADEVLPYDDVHALPLPERLGGGVMFDVTGEQGTTVWIAPSWTGPLRRLGRLVPDARGFVAGFDRVYVQGEPGVGLRALDPATGQIVDLGSLPPSPSYGKMAFVDAWFGAVEVSGLGVVVTFDAGDSWSPLALGAGGRALTAEAGRLIVDTSYGRVAVSPDGALSRAGGDADDSVFRGVGEGVLDHPPRPQREAASEVDGLASLPIGRRPLRRALLSGLPSPDGTVLTLWNGALVRVRARDGAVLDRDDQAYVGPPECNAVGLGRHGGFVCGVDAGDTEIFEFVPPFSVRHVLSFDGPRFVADSGNGSLVVRGRCEPARRAPAGVRSHCVVRPNLAYREVRVRGDVGSERVVALGDGSVAVLIPPRLGASGSLTVIPAADSGKEAEPARRLTVDRVEARSRSLVSRGTWLEGLQETEPGVVRGWVAGAERLVGVEVSLATGSIKAGDSRARVASTVVSGPHALWLSRDGAAAETSDFGFQWHTVDLPLKLADLEPTEVAPSAGCSRAGCVIGPWMWTGHATEDAADRGAAEGTDLPVLIAAGGAEFHTAGFACGADGRLGRPRTSFSSLDRVPGPNAAHRRRLGGLALFSAVDAASLESSGFRSFFGAPPPPRRHGELGFDYGRDDQMVQFRAYAWGERDADWTTTASWTVRGADRFDIDSAWSTAATRSPWPDSVAAAEVFAAAKLRRHNFDWSLLLDSGGRAGALRVRASGATQLFLVEEGKPILDVPGADDHGLESMNSAVRTGDAWYLASQDDGAIHVVRVGGGVVSPLVDFPLQVGVELMTARLVRSTSEDALGVFVKAPTGWYVYPLGLTDGRVEAPEFIPRERLTQLPRACDPDQHGMLLESGFPLVAVHPSESNTFVDFDGDYSELSIRSLEARLVLASGQLCVRSLAARVQDGLPVRPPTVRAPAVRPLPMVVTDRVTDRRIGFRCGRADVHVSGI